MDSYTSHLPSHHHILLTDGHHDLLPTRLATTSPCTMVPSELDMETAAEKVITFSITFRGSTQALSLRATSTLGELQDLIEEQTNVPPPLQKILYKGRKGKPGPEMTLEEAGLKDKMKVTLLGSTEEELNQMKTAENEKRRRDEILRVRAERRPPKVRRT